MNCKLVLFMKWLLPSKMNDFYMISKFDIMSKYLTLCKAILVITSGITFKQ